MPLSCHCLSIHQPFLSDLSGSGRCSEDFDFTTDCFCLAEIKKDPAVGFLKAQLLFLWTKWLPSYKCTLKHSQIYTPHHCGNPDTGHNIPSLPLFCSISLRLVLTGMRFPWKSNLAVPMPFHRLLTVHSCAPVWQSQCVCVRNQANQSFRDLPAITPDSMAPHMNAVMIHSTAKQ